ncbi:hypothetical protein [Rubellicoccus peritrichatus]|uniref:DUF2017 domain-containing protein n=1 Tax=Rubellicoccus peritrichatus TaxID=3080537 RepID=A0AAQ3LCJ4_9BACT|nr:hypothetical protein [Puniceicoccus sp. CR14]WOO42867.1 hypothetical protein RZN69_07160 [Puniceicoccus sp. CR14]
MPEIHLKISPYMAGPLLDILRAVSKSLNMRLAVPLHGPEETDQELLDAWREGLLETLSDDVGRLLDFLEEAVTSQLPMQIDEATSMQLVRAASALRLRLQESFLKRVPSDKLESGEVDFNDFEPETQQVYGIYLFLARLQEQIINALEPDIWDWQGDAE